MVNHWTWLDDSPHLMYVNDVSNALSVSKSLMSTDNSIIFFFGEYCYKTLYVNAQILN